ncbi:MafI family immunity protein [Actinopolyspora lacussalsi]|nr:MafI family immunity protein [Actinopolyspora righensis]
MRNRERIECIENSLIPLIRRVPALSDEDRKDMTELAVHAEWGIAFENMCAQLGEYDAVLTRELHEEIVRVGRMCGVEPRTWKNLDENVEQGR